MAGRPGSKCQTWQQEAENSHLQPRAGSKENDVEWYKVFNLQVRPQGLNSSSKAEPHKQRHQLGTEPAALGDIPLTTTTDFVSFGLPPGEV